MAPYFLNGCGKVIPAVRKDDLGQRLESGTFTLRSAGAVTCDILYKFCSCVRDLRVQLGWMLPLPSPWDVKTCSQIKIHSRFVWIFCLLHPKVGKFLPDYTASLPRRQIIFVCVIRKERKCAFVSSKYESTRFSTVIFIVAPSILISPKFFIHQQMHFLLILEGQITQTIWTAASAVILVQYLLQSHPKDYYT
jgi:hypothetical protein